MPDEDKQEQEDRYYTHYHPGDCCWELWERTRGRGHKLRACFFDGDTQHSPLAEMVLSLLHAVAKVAEQEVEDRERVYEPLTPEEIGKRIIEYEAQQQAKLRQE